MLNTLNKYLPRLMAVLLAAVLSLSGAVPAFADETEEASSVSEEAPEAGTAETPKVTGGSCGANLSWSFSAGTLTVSGSGKMDNFRDDNLAPWYGIRDDIVRVSFPEGMTSIGNLAFYQCGNISSVTVPSSVTEIGNSAFAFCGGIEMLRLGSGVTRIGRAAFSDCYAITSVSLPNGLKSIDTKAFHRCETITTITVPSSVTSMGTSVFSYCKNLVSATINANITDLPEYTFYGCEKLSKVNLPSSVNTVNDYSFEGCGNLDTVYYNGENITPEELEEKTGATVSEGSSSGPVSSGTIVDNGDGTATGESTTVTEGEDSVVSTKNEITIDIEEGTTESEKTEVSATVNGENGWTEVNEETKNVIDKFGTDEDGNEQNVNITLYILDCETVDEGFIETIAGKDVTVTVMTADGSVWKINGKDIDVAELSGEYSLVYMLEAASPEACSELGVSTAFVLRFLSPAQVNAEVLIRIGPSFGRQNATLFQKDKKEFEKVQTAVVDNEGYAHFYLGSVSEKTEYYIGMNVPGASGEAIVPENMLAEYGNPEYIEPIKYEITGRTSSWGMNLGQVMGILGIVMAGVIILVGGIMFIWNKTRLKNGYVPKFDDEE